MRLHRLWGSGEPFIWLTGGALALALLLVAGLVGLILVNSLGFFWPKDVVRLTLNDGKAMTGQIVEREAVPGKPGQYRIKLKVADRDLYGADFQWVEEAQIARREYPAEAVVIERVEWGLLIGTIRELREGGKPAAVGSVAGWAEMEKRLPEAARVRRDIRGIEKGEIGRINFEQEKIRLKLRRLELQGVKGGAEVEALQREMGVLQARYEAEEGQLAALRARQGASVLGPFAIKPNNLNKWKLVCLEPVNVGLVAEGAAHNKTCPLGRVDFVIGNDWNLFFKHRRCGILTRKMFVSAVIGMEKDCYAGR